MKKEPKKQSMTKQIFTILIEGLDDILTVGYNPIGVAKLGGLDAYKDMRYRKGRSLEAERKARQKQALERLEKQRLITLKKKGEVIYFKLTDYGIEEALKQSIIKQKNLLPRGEYCYVSFDVPEHVKEVRNALRELLKKADFTMIHLSLWATNKNVADNMVIFVKSLNAERWIHVLVGKAKT